MGDAPKNGFSSGGGMESGGVGARSELDLSLKFGWASGAFGVAILSNGASALMLVYLTTIVGIAGWVAGLILMVGKLYDVVSDPLAGWLSDRHRSPAGRRRPFLLWGAFINAVAMILIFTVPLHGNTPLVWLYVLIVNVIYTTGYSIYNVPLLAMATEMTQGYDERSVLQGWRVMASSLGTAVTSIGTGAILGALGHRTGPGGRVVNHASDYALLAVLFAVLTFAGMITAWAGTRRARFTEQVRTSADWRAQTASFFANRAALIIIGVKSAQLIGIASTSAATFFMLVHVLKLSPAVLPAFALPVLIVSFIVTPLLARLSKVIGKRGGYLIGAVSTAIAALSWVMARPGDPIYFLMLRGAVTGVAFSANVMFAMSMLNDAMEMDALRTGLRREGLYAALYSFVEKFGNAVGPAVVGAALSLAGFDATASVTAANAASVRQAALLGVAYIPAACAVVAVILLSFYRLDRKTLDAARTARLAGEFA
jgi:GPH family glycoside/pentoside/hexuronide:cation symporter